jgi:hypothetical protein
MHTTPPILKYLNEESMCDFTIFNTGMNQIIIFLMRSREIAVRHMAAKSHQPIR